MNHAHRTTAHTVTAKLLALAGALVLATALLTVGGSAAPASAATSAQCNGVGGGGGQGYDCSVTITNTYDVATGLGSSTVRTIICNGAANTVFGAGDCTDSGILSFPELTETVDQCNGTVGGNGVSLYCSVTMTNTIIGGATTSAATVNQCVGSLGGGGTVLRVCDPDQSTTSAAVDQCNGSVNGGGGHMVCTVGSSSTANSAFDVSVTQCNGSAEGTGNLMECDVQITTIVQPADDGDGSAGSGGSDGSDGTASSGELADTGPAPVGASLGGLALLLLVTGAWLIAARTRTGDPARA